MNDRIGQLLGMTRSLSVETGQCELCRMEAAINLRAMWDKIPKVRCLQFSYDDETLCVCAAHLTKLAERVVHAGLGE